MTTKPLWLIALALLVFPVARPAPAADPGGPGRPVCALLDPGKVPRAALLEAKLLADPTVTWVERANVDAVLGEQKLQSMFGPQGVGERARLGKLLKADVLVMIRAAQTERDPTAKGRVLEVVVSETTGGLRLLTRAIPETASAEADADALAAAVRSGIRKSREPVKGVVAVPPFACRNLVPEFDHLKWAYAKLAEAVAVAQPGVVVVELAEAEALGRELAVSAPGTRLVRPAPVYLMGEYRHEGKGADQLVTLTVRAERDGKAVGEPAAWKKTPADVPPALREWTAGVMGTVLGNRVGPPADAGAEAKVLAARARDFERTGDWSEALALIEAATLLAPDALDLRAAALPLITQKLRQIGADFGWRASTPDDVRLIHRLQARGLSHLGAFIDRDDDLRAYKEQGVAPLGLVFLSTLKWFGPHSSPAAGWPKEHLGPILEERRAVVLRWIPRVTRVIPRSEFYVRDAVAELPPRERYALTERIIIQLQDVPYPRARTMEYLRYAWEGRPRFHTRITAEDDLADCRAMLGRLARAENPEIRAAAAEFGRQLDDAMKPPVPLGPAPRPDGVGFQPIELLPQGNGLRARVEGIRSIGPGIDVVWGGSAIYLMKKKGQLRPVWAAKNGEYTVRTVCFDGRYVWATTWQRGRWPVLLVIDPGSEKVWEASGADGLPQGSDDQLTGGKWHALDVAPLEPGRACVAGSFGRAWVATATFDAASGSVAVKVIHEAREIPTGKDVNEGLRATVAFSSRGMFTLTGRPGPGGAVERRVILWRDGEGADSERHQLRSRPLVIDPDTPAVAVLSNRPKDTLPFFRHSYTSTETAAFTIETSQDDRGTIRAHLLRAGLPDLTARRVGDAGAASPVETNPSVQVVYAHGDRLHYIWSWHDRLPAGPGPHEKAVREHFEWWTVDLDGTRPRRVGVNIPRVYALGVSSHHGLVAVLHKEKIGFVPHLVEFDDPPKNEKDRAPGAALPPAR